VNQYSSPAGANAPAAAGWVVLIIDDVPDNLLVLTTALKYHGAEVHTATSGEEGLALLKSLRPTVLLLDIQMPRMNGWDMLRAVRAIPDHAQLPVIAVTAYAMDGDRERILAAGFDGYIAKPFNVLVIIQEIQRYLNRTHKPTYSSRVDPR
jgi:CheY-like chemotaxis protein